MTTPVRQPPSTLRNTREQALLLWFEEFGIADVPIVGGKNASLGEMIRHLVRQRHSHPEWICHDSAGLPALSRIQWPGRETAQALRWPIGRGS